MIYNHLRKYPKIANRLLKTKIDKRMKRNLLYYASRLSNCSFKRIRKCFADNVYPSVNNKGMYTNQPDVRKGFARELPVYIIITLNLYQRNWHSANDAEL